MAPAPDASVRPAGSAATAELALPVLVKVPVLGRSRRITTLARTLRAVAASAPRFPCFPCFPRFLGAPSSLMPGPVSPFRRPWRVTGRGRRRGWRRGRRARPRRGP